MRGKKIVAIRMGLPQTLEVVFVKVVTVSTAVANACCNCVRN